MKNRFIIKSNAKQSWIGLDYIDGDTIIYTDDFESAYRFNSYKRCIEFLDEQRLAICLYQIFELKINPVPVN